MYELLNSDWLLRMCEKSAHSPQARLTAVFDIVGHWLDAPRLRAALSVSEPFTPAADEDKLAQFFARNAAAAGLREPHALAQQLHLLLLGALHAELRTAHCNALKDAQRAARLLVDKSLPARQQALRQPAAWGAALALLLMLPLLWSARPQESPEHPIISAATEHAQPSPHQHVSPAQLAALNHTFERQRHGVCQYPQALMLPAEHRAMFLNHVVSGIASTSSLEQAATLQQLAQKVECYYAPAAMISS